MTNKTFIDIHVLQTVPFSNINRDDSGSPKTGVFGGTTRARVSSQAQKKAVRRVFESLLPADQLATRSKRWPKLIAERVRDLDASISEEQALELALEALKAVKIGVEAPKKAKKGDGDEVDDAESGEHKTKYLVFFGDKQVEDIARELVKAHSAGEKVDAKQIKILADTSHSIEVGLFGRMIADATDLNVDASTQVAHAVSVHAVDNEWDYFTAVDDEQPEDNAGAGMIGTVEFNSSTLYRYASVNAHSLLKTIGDPDNTAQAIVAFVRAFITTLPSGKSNTFANFSLPEAVVVTVRDTQPINYAGAFETAITADPRTGRSRAQNTASALARYAKDITEAYGQEPLGTYVLHVGEAMKPLAEIGESVTINELVENVGALVSLRVAEPASA